MFAVTNIEAQFQNCSSSLFLPFFFEKRIWIKHKVKTRQGEKSNQTTVKDPYSDRAWANNRYLKGDRDQILSFVPLDKPTSHVYKKLDPSSKTYCTIHKIRHMIHAIGLFKVPSKKIPKFEYEILWNFFKKYCVTRMSKWILLPVSVDLCSYQEAFL